jgi:YD repeat-containing protein
MACTPKDQFNAAGRPLVITKMGKTYRFEYYPSGLISKATDPNDRVTLIEYDTKAKKISKFTQGTMVTNFIYNDQGLLKETNNNRGKRITLTYLEKGLIGTITDQDGTTLKIVYEGRFGKPAIVGIEGGGYIKVTYTNDGHVDKVYSPQGETTAIAVALTFSNLLELIEPKDIAYIFNFKGDRK